MDSRDGLRCMWDEMPNLLETEVLLDVFSVARRPESGHSNMHLTESVKAERGTLPHNGHQSNVRPTKDSRFEGKGKPVQEEDDTHNTR